MNINDFEILFSKKLNSNYKTADLDKFNKMLIREKVDVSFLKDIINDKQQYHRTYFQVSLGLIDDINDKLAFIENNFDKLSDWWHVDQLEQFIDKNLSFDIAYNKALQYINNPLPYARRWGYVMFMPSLVKNENRFKDIFNLFKEDDVYHVVMAQAWLISYLGIYYPKYTLAYLKSKPLSYDIVGKAIQKICDSFRVSKDYKEMFKEVRKLYK